MSRAVDHFDVATLRELAAEMWATAATAPDRVWTTHDAAVAEVEPLEPWSDHRDADFAALVAENASERQSASALDWYERGVR